MVLLLREGVKELLPQAGGECAPNNMGTASGRLLIMFNAKYITAQLFALNSSLDGLLSEESSSRCLRLPILAL